MTDEELLNVDEPVLGPWKLLRQMHDAMTNPETLTPELFAELRFRIGTALVVVEQRMADSGVEWSDISPTYDTAYPDGDTRLTVSQYLPNEPWSWWVEIDREVYGKAASEAEAKARAEKTWRVLRWLTSRI